MVNKHSTEYSKPTVLRVKKFGTMRFHYTVARLGKMTRWTTPNVGKNVKQPEFWERKMVPSLWKTTWKFKRS